MNSQFELLKTRRFLPFFITQFFGAFNDNLFKNAVLILVTYNVVNQLTVSSELLVNFAAGLFILPFFMFSAIAGQFSDKYEKSRLIRLIKLLEVVIMLLAAFSLYFESISLMLVTLFLLGAQSAFFGPAKYGILPQHLSEPELVGGNALLEAGTFLAILLGTILGGVLIASGDSGILLTGFAGIFFALVGYISSRFIPAAPAVASTISVDWNVWRSTTTIIRAAQRNRVVFLSILGISWFWLYGAVVLAQLPILVKEVFSGNENLVTLLLAVFSIGIGVGSLCCERLAAYRIELGLVPLGAFGLTLFAVDLYWVTATWNSTGIISPLAFLNSFSGWRVLVDLTLMALFGGFYIVPLYALVQNRSGKDELSRNIAANNILNAAFMVLAAFVAGLLLMLGVSIPQLFLILGVANLIIAVYIFYQVPEFLLRVVVWFLIHTIYRLKEQELHNIPEHGPVVLVCNHVSFVDALLIGAACRRPIRFVMDHNIYNAPFLNYLFRTAAAIPIASSKENPQLLDEAFDKISAALDQGEVVCIFPEGKITYDGNINKFRTGIERILSRNPVPVVPLALRGVYGSFFSRQGGKAMQLRNLTGKLFAEIELISAPAVEASHATAELLQVEVSRLRGDVR